MNADDDDVNKGVIRFDLKFPVPVKDGKPRELWIDHAIVQETSPTHAENTLEFLEDDLNHLPENLHLQKLMVGKSGGTKLSLMLSIVLQKHASSNSSHHFFIRSYCH